MNDQKYTAPRTVKATTRRMQRAAADKRHAEYFAERAKEQEALREAIVAANRAAQAK